jgi:hypothetical protein
MRVAKEDIPVKINAPGAVARQLEDFGDATGYGTIGAEYFSLDAGVDMTPLLQGLENDLCHSPHWGYIIEGQLTVTYKDGSEEDAAAGDGRRGRRVRVVQPTARAHTSHGPRKPQGPGLIWL